MSPEGVGVRPVCSRPPGRVAIQRGVAMLDRLTRRRFPAAMAGLALGGPLLAGALAPAPADVEADSITFPVLGDLHFDRLEHHDLDWLRRDHPGDVAQVENYSKLTREIMPGLFDELRGVGDATGRP